MAYVVPTWKNNANPPLSASNMQDISDAIGIHDSNISTLQTNSNALSEAMISVQSNVTNLLADNGNLKAGVLTFTNAVVSATAWGNTQNSAISSLYPHQASISCPGVTAQHISIVCFNLIDAESGNYASVSVPGNSIITIYAKVKPTSDMTIPGIAAFKQA